jgi:hypothetical protein
MRKFSLVTAAVIVAGLGGWIAATSQARVAPPRGASISPMQIMAASANLPTQHFVDYSLIFPVGP